MSFEPDSEEIKIRQIREELKELRIERNVFNEGSEITTNTNIMGGASGQASMNHGAMGDILQPVTNIIDGLVAGVNSIDIVGAFETVSNAVGEGLDSIVHYLNAEFEGLSVTLRPLAGETLTLVANSTSNASVQGNIMLTSDLVLNDEQVAKFKFQSDKLYADGIGGWVLESTTSATGGSGSTSTVWKTPVRTIADGFNFFFPLIQEVLNGVTLVLGDRILLKDELNAANNGIWEVALPFTVGTPNTFGLIRPDDFNSDEDAVSGVTVFVEEGTIQDVNTTWQLITANPIILGTTDQIWIPLAGEVFTWSADHDADGNNLLNVATIQSAATFVASIGTVRLSFDEFIAWRDVTDSIDSTFRYTASDEFEWRIGANLVLTVGIGTTDFEQNNLIRVGDINSFTGDHTIGFSDPFHQIIGRRLIPASVAEYFTGTDGDLRKEQLHTYIDVKVGGSFDIRENGHGPDVSLLAGSDPWFSFRKLSGGAVMQLFSNGFDDTKIILSSNQARRGEIYFNEATDNLIIDTKGGTLTEGTILATDGQFRFGALSGFNVSFQELNMLQNDITLVDRLEFGEFSGVLNGINTPTIYISSVDTGAMVFNNDPSAFVWTHSNLSTMVEDLFGLTKIGDIAQNFTLYNNRAFQIGTAGTFSFSANMQSAPGAVTAFITSNTETATGSGSGSMSIGVLESGNPEIYMSFNDNNTQEIKIERDIDMQLGEIRNILTLDFDGFGGIQGVNSIDFFHTNNTIFSLTDMFYTTDVSRKHEFLIGGVAEYSFERFGLDIHTNYIRFDGTTGLATQTGEPKLFADSTNSDHLSIKSGDGSIIDLEQAGGGGSTSFIAFTADADLNMGAFDIKSTVDPSVNTFRIIFDGHSDSDTYISNSTTADRINIWRNGVNIMAFTAESNFFTDINMQGNDIDNVDDINMSGSGSILSMNVGDIVGVDDLSFTGTGSLISLFGGSISTIGNLTFANAFGILNMGGSNITNAFKITFQSSSGIGIDLNGRDISDCGDLEIDGDLNHDGSNVGFYGQSPRARRTVNFTGGAIDIALLLQTLGNTFQGYGLIISNI